MMTTNKYDVLIIGGGHNGLTAASYLSRNGLNVKVLERRGIVGGAAITEEFHPNYRNSICSYTVSLLNEKIIADLELKKYGLSIINRNMTEIILGENNSYLYINDDVQSTVEQLEKTHPQDAKRYPAFKQTIQIVADLLRDIVLQSPPNIGGGLADLFKAGKLANRMRKLSPKMQREVIKLFTMSVADYLAEWFEHPIMVGAKCYSAVVGNMASVYAPGTAYVLLHHAFGITNGQKGVWGHAIGGMGAITQAMAKSAQAHGCEIAVNAAVKEVIVENNIARGVVLEDGSKLHAKVIIANVNPRLLFQRLIKREHLDEDFAHQMDHYRCRSGSLRMNFALDSLPQFNCLQDMPDPSQFLYGSIMFSPSRDYAEAAYQDAVRDGWAKRPMMEMFIPTLYDNTLAPPGKHVASLFCQHYNPQLPNGENWDNVKDSVVESIIDYVTEFAPNFRDAIVAYTALTPLDLEREFGLIGGDIFHGCLSPDQLFAMRPVAEYANYRMPLANLYLCGSGAHPGGGVTGCPGHNAANEVLYDLRKKRISI